MLINLSHLLIVLFVAIIFASTVRPLLHGLRRRGVPRWAAILLIYSATALAVIGLITVAIPPLVGLIMDMSQNNQLANEVSYSLMRAGLAFQRQFEIYIPVVGLPAQFQTFTEQADQTLREQALPFASNAFYVTGQITLAIVISIYWLTARATALRTALRAAPRQYQPTLSHFWIDTEEMLGSYFRGQITLALVIGLASFVGLTILRVPNALPLAVIAGMLEFIPFIGPIAAAVPAVLMGLTVSPLIAILVGVWYTLVQQVEGNYLVPKIMSNSVSLHPLVVLIAFFAGFQLNGIVGALLSLPIAGIIQLALRHLPAAAHADDPAADDSVAQQDGSAPDGAEAEPDSVPIVPLAVEPLTGEPAPIQVDANHLEKIEDKK